jgi:pyridoxamine 5'-phosphate oxidase
MKSTDVENDSDPLYQQAIERFRVLLAEAAEAGEHEPTAMTLATSDAAGRISARIVLLKSVDERGFAFYTNYASAKAHDLAAHPQAALCFVWKKLRDIVQVRIEGVVEKVGVDESDAYFALRPRASRIGAWASAQSRTLPERALLDARVAQMEARFADADVPRPPDWGGYRLAPDMIELWFGQRARLHDRERYERVDGKWTKRLLYP